MYKNGHRHQSNYDLQEDFHNIKAALAEATEDIKGRAAEILTESVLNVRDKSLDAKDTVADYVSEQPFKAIGIAALAGFVIGLLFRR